MSKRLRYTTEPVNPDPTAQPGAGLTQAQVDEIVKQRVAEASRRAKETADAELKSKLGDVSLDDLLEQHKQAQAAADAQKSEAQRALDAANTAKAEAEKIKADAAAELHQVRVASALVAAGAPEAAVAAIIVPGVTVGSTPEEIKTAVDALKTTLPALFTKTAVSSTDPGPGPKRASVLSGDGADGLAEFERRFPKTT